MKYRRPLYNIRKRKAVWNTVSAHGNTVLGGDCDFLTKFRFSALNGSGLIQNDFWTAILKPQRLRTAKSADKRDILYPATVKKVMSKICDFGNFEKFRCFESLCIWTPNHPISLAKPSDALISINRYDIKRSGWSQGPEKKSVSEKVWNSSWSTYWGLVWTNRASRDALSLHDYSSE